MSKRFGSVLTNVSGTANQILRVNSAGDGFEFFSPATIPSYTITNDSTDRAFDAVDTTIDEVANVLATLVKDLQSLDFLQANLTPFQWSTSEQVWPFEKADDGSTLYAIRVDCGALPNTNTKRVAVTSITDTRKVHKFWGTAKTSTSSETLPLPWSFPQTQNAEVGIDVIDLSGTRYVSLYTSSDMSTFTDTSIYLIYKH